MAPRINLVVPCSKRKRFPVPRAVRLRRWQGGSVRTRARDWITVLNEVSAARVPAADLYAGDAWAVALAAAGGPVRLWVCSAGYGLLRAESLLVPYSATFAQSDPDSVRRFRPDGEEEVGQAWWDELAQWVGPRPGDPRTLAELAAGDPAVPLVVAVSDVYLRAIEPDLIAAAGRLRRPEALAVISAGAVPSESLRPYRVPCDARWQVAVGGALVSLNVRLAARAIRELPPADLTVPVLATRFTDWLTGVRPAVRPARSRLTDEAVLRYIRDGLAADPAASWSRLHRDLRDSGRACQAERFSRLFRIATEEADVPR